MYWLGSYNKFITIGHVYQGHQVSDILITSYDQALSIFPFD